MDPGTFPVLLLIGRPASGKSEIIDFLKHLGAEIRRERYHLGDLDVLDDFPMLWAWFEEDDILSRKLNRPRLHTDEQGYFIDRSLWHLLIERLSLDFQKRLSNDTAYSEHKSALVEFSRGSEHGGYADALPHLGKNLLDQAGILYVRVSFAESLRKNRRRYNPGRPDSILEHSLPDNKLERLYGDDDWSWLAPGDSGFLKINSAAVPYAVFENEDDITTGKPELLASRLEAVLGSLWELRQYP